MTRGVKSNRNPRHFVEAHLVSCIVRVEAWFAVAAAFSRVPPFFTVCRDAGGPEGVAADLDLEAELHGAALEKFIAYS